MPDVRQGEGGETGGAHASPLEGAKGDRQDGVYHTHILRTAAWLPLRRGLGGATDISSTAAYADDTKTAAQSLQMCLSLGPTGSDFLLSASHRADGSISRADRDHWSLFSPYLPGLCTARLVIR